MQYPYYYHYYYYYIHLSAFFQDNLDKPAPERQTIPDFAGARDNGVAVASAGLYANHLHLAADRQPHQYLTTQFYRPDVLPAAEPTVSKH